MFSSVKLAKAIKFNPTAFYALSLNFFLLNHGLINGTELLSLVFLEFTISFLVENKSISGLFLGLSALSRYAGLVLFPIIFLHLNIKKIFKSLFLFGTILSFWFIYNFYKYGNFFMSIADQYANNILFRNYLIQPIQWTHFLYVQNVLFPFFILGFFLVIYLFYNHLKSLDKWDKNSFLNLIDTLKVELIMFFLFFYSIYSYYSIPVKNVRYLFNLVLPTFYFSYIGIRYLVRKVKDNKDLLIFIAFLFFVLSSSIMLVQFFVRDYETPKIYNSAIDALDELDLSDCSVMSNSWVMLNYLERPSIPPPRTELINEYIEQGQIIVLFKHVGEPEYVRNKTLIKSLPIIYNHKNYVIIGTNKCIPITTFEESYLQQVDKAVYSVWKEHVSQNPCHILFQDSTIIENICDYINLN